MMYIDIPILCIYIYISVCVCHCSCANRQWPQNHPGHVLSIGLVPVMNHPQPPGVFHNSWEMIAKSFFAAWIRCVNGRRLALGFHPTSGPYRAIGHLAACA